MARRLGQMLKALRQRRGLTQDQLAQIAGYSKGYISLLESGARKNPSLPTLKRLAKALKVKVGELLE
jgi:transcriptional regulator with XRE-family HTH domain